jgi:hypothetical protein
MKPRYVRTTCAVMIVLGAIAWVKRDYLIPPTILSVRIGEPYEDVIKGSTFPVVEKSDAPDQKHNYGSTWIYERSVVIVFNDPQHGFTLPPTKFGAIGYDDWKVSTITTSPMLDALRFDDAIALLNRLQADFKKAGWEPMEPSVENTPSWFDTTSPAGLDELRHGGTRVLIVPRKYMMYFNFKCWDNCLPEPNKRSVYLIDVGIGEDFTNYFVGPRRPRAESSSGPKAQTVQP